MILIHRLTPLAVGLISILGFASLLYGWLPPVWSLIATFVVDSLLYWRLLQWRFRTFQFWHFFGMPALYLLSVFGMIFLFENPLYSIVLSLLSIIFLTLFAEYVFQYIHLPSQYQPYSIEYLTLLLNILSIFFLSSVGYGLNLLIQTPVWLITIIFYPIALFIMYGSFWVSKVDEARSKPYAIVSSLLATEFFLAFSFLPSGMYTNAALLTLFFYIFLGLTRLQSQNKLSTHVVRRYLILAAILAIIIIATTNWI